MRFSEAAADFLTFCAVERRLSSHTLDAYRCDLNDFGKWLPVEVLTVSQISDLHLKEYLLELVSRRELAMSTVRRRFACLRALVGRMVTLGQMADPFVSWRPELPRQKRLPRALSRIETTLLLKITSSQFATIDLVLALATRLMLSTGIRVGELCRLRAEDVAPDGTTLRIHGKGSRERVAYITDPDLRRDLGQLLQDRERTSGSQGALFLNRRGFSLQPQTIRRRLTRQVRSAGIGRKVTPHMLRHTAATLLVETGVDIRFVQRLLGHSSIATTEIYTHISDEALRSSLERANVLRTLAMTE